MRGLDQLISKLTNNIQNLVKVLVDCLNGPPKCLVHHSKPLVVSNNKEEHSNLLLNRATMVLWYKPSSSKKVTQCKKGGLWSS
jgi:hypothetical protein